MSKQHRAMIEATNAGHYFADCSCGWSGGVYYGRTVAREAHAAHVMGGPGPRPVQAEVYIGPRARGMSDL